MCAKSVCILLICAGNTGTYDCVHGVNAALRARSCVLICVREIKACLPTRAPRMPLELAPNQGTTTTHKHCTASINASLTTNTDEKQHNAHMGAECMCAPLRAHVCASIGESCSPPRCLKAPIPTAPAAPWVAAVVRAASQAAPPQPPPVCTARHFATQSAACWPWPPAAPAAPSTRP